MNKHSYEQICRRTDILMNKHSDSVSILAQGPSNWIILRSSLVTGCTKMPKPKKTDEALVQTLEEIHARTRDNAAELRTRRGSGLRLTLKNDARGAVEKRYLNFLYNNKKRIEDTLDLAARLLEIDAMLATSESGRAAENRSDTITEIQAWATVNVSFLLKVAI